MGREIEDLEALIAHAGGSVCLYGASAGGGLALEAAAAGAAIDRLAVYEVPYDTAGDSADRQQTYLAELEELLADGRRGDALELFMRTAGAAEDDIEGARRSPVWSSLEAMAHTLTRGCGAFGPPPSERLATIKQPVLAITGKAADSHTVGLGADFFQRAAAAIATAVPNAERATIEHDSHVPDPLALAPMLQRFFDS